MKTQTLEIKESVEIFIVIPAYNESNTLLHVIEQVKQTGFTNIIVVDDGSSDNTYEIAKKCGCFTIKHNINRGPGAATQTGLELAGELGADIVVTLDGDGQFNPQNIHTIISPLLQKKSDVVIGSRFKKKNAIPFLRRFYNFLASIITFFLSNVYVSDSQSGLKGFTKHALSKIQIKTSGFEFSSEIIREIGHNHLHVVEVPIDVYYTKESMRKGQNFAQGVKTTAKLIIRSLMR